MKSYNFPYTILKKSVFHKLNNKLRIRENEINLATTFVKEIEKGNLENKSFQIEEGSESELAGALFSMRDQMKKIAEEEKERNWATEGLAKFVEILRTNNNDIKELADNILKNLVKYIQSNQGGLFIVNDENSKDVHIELIACYAYEKKKYLEKRIEIGQGLIGQAYLEKDKIHMTNIPQKYIHITSGLGEATPGHLLIAPLMVNDNVYGIIELASFKPFKNYQIDFVMKLGESIASAISMAKINERTQKLLINSQTQTEEMRAQEEEMRQNMEELASTQEEIHRVLKRYKERKSI